MKTDISTLKSTTVPKSEFDSQKSAFDNLKCAFDNLESKFEYEMSEMKNFVSLLIAERQESAQTAEYAVDRLIEESNILYPIRRRVLVEKAQSVILSLINVEYPKDQTQVYTMLKANQQSIFTKLEPWKDDFSNVGWITLLKGKKDGNISAHNAERDEIKLAVEALKLDTPERKGFDQLFDLVYNFNNTLA